MSRVGIGIRPPKKRALRIVDATVLYHSLAGFPPATAFFWGGQLSEMPTSRQHGFVRHYDLVRDARHEALPAIVCRFKRSMQHHLV